MASNEAQLVTTDWLADHLEAPDIAILDASWHLPGSGRDGHEEFLEGHIPGARFFDIDDICDETSPLPHMLPSAAKFSSRMRRMGIGDGHRVIVYDSHGMFTAARVWWMFKVFGHDDVAVLDGGLKKWRAEGRPEEEGEPRPAQERHFTAKERSMMVADADDVAAAIADGSTQVVDARSPGRFAGREAEPREGLRAGHMPGAMNVHYASLIDPDTGEFVDDEELGEEFAAAGVDLSKPIITTCGSGVTAAILSFALVRLGHRDHALYDGSWSEWGLGEERPVERDGK